MVLLLYIVIPRAWYVYIHIKSSGNAEHEPYSTSGMRDKDEGKHAQFPQVLQGRRNPEGAFGPVPEVDQAY